MLKHLANLAFALFPLLALFACLQAHPAGGLVARAPPAEGGDLLGGEGRHGYNYEMMFKRALVAETLDGSIVDPIVVDFLDQFQYFQNEVINGAAEEGSAEYSRIVQESLTVSAILNDLIRGYATIVSATPDLPEETGTILSSPEPEATITIDNVPIPFPTSSRSSSSTAVPSQDRDRDQQTTTTPPPVPQSTSTAIPPVSTGGNTIITVTPGDATIIAQPEPSVIVVASQGTTRTVTALPTPPASSGNAGGGAGAGGSGAGSGGLPANDGVLRQPTTTIVTVRGGVTQTIAIGASAEMTFAPSNNAIKSAKGSWGWISVVGVVGLLMNAL